MMSRIRLERKSDSEGRRSDGGWPGTRVNRRGISTGRGEPHTNIRGYTVKPWLSFQREGKAVRKAREGKDGEIFSLDERISPIPRSQSLSYLLPRSSAAAPISFHPTPAPLPPQPVSTLLAQSRTLGQSIENLQEKVLKIQHRLSLPKPSSNMRPSPLSFPNSTQKHIYKSALQSLVTSCQRYLNASAGCSPPISSDLSMSFARESLVSELEIAKTCVSAVGFDRNSEGNLREIGDLSHIFPTNMAEMSKSAAKMMQSMCEFREKVENELTDSRERLEKLRFRLIAYRRAAIINRKRLIAENSDKCGKLEADLDKYKEEFVNSEKIWERIVSDMTEKHEKEMELIKKTDKNAKFVSEIDRLKRDLDQSRKTIVEKGVKITENQRIIENLREEIADLSQKITLFVSKSTSDDEIIQSLRKSNEFLTSKLKRDKIQIESQISTLFSELKSINRLRFDHEIRSERWEMTANDLESRILRSETGPNYGKNPDFFHIEDGECRFELQRMVIEELQTRYSLHENQSIAALQAEIDSVKRENSLLLMENSQLCHSDQSCNCVFTRPFPSDTVDELGLVVSHLKEKWVQELDIEERLRLEIAALQAENWTFRQRNDGSGAATPLDSASKPGDITPNGSGSPISNQDISVLGRVLPCQTSQELEGFYKETETEVEELRERGRKLGQIEMIVMGRFPEEKDVVEAVRKAMGGERRSVETAEGLTTMESRASLEPLPRSSPFIETPRSYPSTAREYPPQSRISMEPPLFPLLLKDPLLALIRTIPLQ